MGKPDWAKRACGLFVLCATTAIASPAQTFTTLHSFDGKDGREDEAALVQATDGKLYGTTAFGGANDFGTVFRISPSGTLARLYSFCRVGACPDGAFPAAPLVQANNGDFYGTTAGGGVTQQGEVFRITSSGTLTTLYSFCSQSGCTDGSEPSAGLVQATNGDFYGTTRFGGLPNQSCIGASCGTVFEITPSGTLTTLHSFSFTDGANPQAGLVQATDGNFYGTTFVGGAIDSCKNGAALVGCGTVFKITPSGTLTTLYSFCSQSGCIDGDAPNGLIQATDGNLYGTTEGGGANGDGTVFKITPAGTLTTLHSFDSTDGANPFTGLIQATDGNFYGTTVFGGANSSGTVFQITPSGTLTTLYSFCPQGGCTGNIRPTAVTQATNGNFYGATTFGGAYDDGTIFSLSVGLGPFVETQPTSGKVGKPVKILGTNLTGATSVSFNGTAATFTVVSSSLITTTVPVGATTGTVQVVTPSGTLSSNVPFRVAP